MKVYKCRICRRKIPHNQVWFRQNGDNIKAPICNSCMKERALLHHIQESIITMKRDFDNFVRDYNTKSDTIVTVLFRLQDLKESIRMLSEEINELATQINESGTFM